MEPSLGENDKIRPSNTENKHPRQQHRQPAWKLAQELPDFLDASASVSASTLGARRLPEIKELWHANAAANAAAYAAATKSIAVGTSCTTTGDSDMTARPSPEGEPLKSSGCKTSSRHLRRRTTSHKGRKRHRYPSSNHEQKDADHVNPDDDDDNDNKKPTMTNRKSQRKIMSKLTMPHEAWWRQQQQQQQQQQQAIKPTEAGKKTLLKWLTTHIWHCKRFHMASIWGWQVPMVHTSRGPKAALRLVRQGKTLLQDVTWYRAANPIVLLVVLDPNQELLVLQSNLQRICPDFVLHRHNPKKLTMATTTCETHVVAGSGMVYSLDRFPRQALGPMTWLIQRRQPLIGSLGRQETWSHYCYFWTHPAIHINVWNEFQTLIETWSSSSSSDHVDKVLTLRNSFHSHPSTTSSNTKAKVVGMACFKLRGINATSTLQKVLKNDTHVAHKCDNHLLLNDDNLHINLPHATPLLITVNVGDTSEASQGAPSIRNGQVLIVVHCESKNPFRNEPGMGWDLYCDASISRVLFVAMVVQGKACPIGIMEEAYIKLDCDPPISDIFPRDYPDTAQGKKYWEAQNNKNCTIHATTDDATLLRLSLEEGQKGGRVDVPIIEARSHSSPSAQKQQKRVRLEGHSFCKLRWHELVKTNGKGTYNIQDNVDDDWVVMMRGSFCTPILDAIAASGTILAGADVDQEPKRRRRRKAKPFSEICHVTPLNRDEAERHMLSCKVLMQSLSLPAVIVCQLKVIGKGTMKPGAEIHSGSEASKPHAIGYVTASSFSAARGCIHGTGIVGASLLLRTISASISSPQQAHKSLAALSIDGARSIELVVNIQTGPASVKATLALTE